MRNTCSFFVLQDLNEVSMSSGALGSNINTFESMFQQKGSYMFSVSLDKAYLIAVTQSIFSNISKADYLSARPQRSLYLFFIM